MAEQQATHDDALIDHNNRPNIGGPSMRESMERDMTAADSTFPVGFHRFHRNRSFNFQMNRWHSLGVAPHQDLVEASQKIRSFEDWIEEMLRLAELAVTEGRMKNAAFYYRAAEFFTTRDDPRKEALYDRFFECFNSAFEDDAIERLEIPYGSTHLPAMRLNPDGASQKGTVVMHGGFDSFIEELHPLARYLANAGYQVVSFDGPGQGGARKKYGHVFDHEWEKPVSAVLDHLELNDVTLIGISMGGWLCLRAAAFEPRVARVIAWSVTFDVLQYTNVIGQKLAKLFFTRFRGFTGRAMIKKMKKSLEYAWFMNNLMYITGTNSPLEGFDSLLQLNEENLHSEAVNQDVLILTGRKDHMIPFKMHRLQVEALTNAKSVTERVFTKEEQAETHCQIGNIGLAMGEITDWLDALRTETN